MVSSIWNAASDGRIDELTVLLAPATPADLEIKDQNGFTPLIQAVKNGHVQVVRLLLDKGADPASVFSQGPVQQLTQISEIIELLNAAQSKMASGNVSSESGYQPNGDAYPPPPHGAYPYYPTLNGPPPIPEGAVFYPLQPNADGQSSPNGGPGNLPPPEIARLIPCRYFPACRYGSSCMFAHPQTPYFQGPMPPPAQYSAPYDPMNQNYNGYYNMPPPPPSFQSPPNGPVPMSSIPSPPVGPPPMSAGPAPNEMPPPPPHPAPFSPNGAPPPVPYPAMSPMMSPSAYPPPGPPGTVPMSAHPLPPLYHQPPPPQAQSPYTTNPPPAPFTVQPNGPYPPGPVSVPVPYSDVNNTVKSPPLNPQSDNYGPPVNPVRDPVVHNRRGGMRRGSLGARKPPCMFFPAGKCKNGDDCRFPHVLSDNANLHHPFAGRGGAPRPRPHVNNVNGNGIGAIEEKMSGMAIRETRSEQGPRVDVGPRPRYPPGYKNGVVNGQANKRPPIVKPQQRVPNADDFPVLPGTATPPAKAGLNGYFGNGNGGSGPTAAQVLQAPAPRREGSVNGVQTRTGSPESTTDQKQDVFINGNGNGVVEHPRIPQPTSVPQKQVPITFASIAAGTPPEAAAEVSVTA